MTQKFGDYVRQRRETLKETFGGEYSLRSVARRIDVSPAFLSNVERGTAMPGDEGVARLSEALREDRDVMMALAGRMPSDVERIVQNRPSIYGLVRALDGAPENRIRAITDRVQSIREGEW